MSGESEAVVSREAGTGTVEAEPASGTDQRIVLHDEPPVYGLAVEYGDFDALFQDAGTVEGRQARMQACGFYYGAVDGDEGPITRRCARHLREELDHASGRTLNDEEYQEGFKRLVRCVVRKADGSSEPESDFSFEARLVFPGSFTFRQNTQLGDPLTRHRYNAEQRMWDGNQGLGRIPVVAQVRNSAGDPVAGVRVCFEFIPAFDPPEGQKDYLTRISGSTEKTRSPRRYVLSKLPRNPSPPFGFNCPESKGGKIPADVLGTLIAQGAVPGFPYEAGAAGRPNNFSATVDSDAEGKAGVVLLPSRMAGDCYKLKVSVLVDGREPVPAEVKTGGVLTVWRELRVARIIVKPGQGAFAGTPAFAPGYAGLSGPLGTINTERMKSEFAKAFHLLHVDARARTPLRMSDRGYGNAIRFAKSRVANPENWDLDVLVKEDFASPYLLWLASDAEYNSVTRRLGSAALDLTDANTWDSISTLIDGLLEQFMIYWNGGALPGITIIRSECGDSYSYWGNPNKPVYSDRTEWKATTSGVALNRRGCYVWYSEAVYLAGMPYGVTENTLHEVGHVLFLRHHWTGGGLGTESGGFSGSHDPHDWCLMGYLPLTTDDFCGKCLLKLRGWDEAAF